MTCTTNFPRRKSNFIYVCILIFILVGINTRNKTIWNTGDSVVFSETISNSSVNPIEFYKSELLEDTNSTPTSGVLMGISGGYGLGNHLFVYATSYALSRNLRIPLLLPLPPETHEEGSKNFTDRGFVLDHFSLPKGTFDYNRKGIGGIYSVNCEMAQNFSLIPEETLRHTKYYMIGVICMDGKFFEEYENELQQIKVKVQNPSEGYDKWKELIDITEWPIAVHVRKGDIEKQYWSAPADYFQQALRRMKKELTIHNLKKEVFVFSDDISWAKENLASFQTQLEWVINFVSGSFGGLTNLEELDLMIRCKSIVISNSTYSWWAAYLMKNSSGHVKKIVIRPQFNATKHQNDPLGWSGITRGDYAISYPEEWIAVEA